MEDEKLCETYPDQTDPCVALRVREVVQRVHQDLRVLRQQRADVARRIGTIKRTVAGLASMYGERVLIEELKPLLNRGKRLSGPQT